MNPMNISEELIKQCVLAMDKESYRSEQNFALASLLSEPPFQILAVIGSCVVRYIYIYGNSTFTTTDFASYDLVIPQNVFLLNE